MAPGERVRSQRERRGWSARELARRAGISNTHVHNIERGRSNVRAPVWAAVARAFGWQDWKLFLSSEAPDAPTAFAPDGQAMLRALRDLLNQLPDMPEVSPDQTNTNSHGAGEAAAPAVDTTAIQHSGAPVPLLALATFLSM